jgi:hypothetical protein
MFYQGVWAGAWGDSVTARRYYAEAYANGPIGQSSGGYRTGVYSALGVASAATAVVGGMAAAGSAGPVIWGGASTAGAGVTVGGTATFAQAVTAFGGQAAFGRAIGLGIGRAGAFARTANITLAEIQVAGVTLPVARYWRDFYQATADAGRGATTALARVQLFERIIELLGG